MEFELQAEDGSNFTLTTAATALFGRDSGFNTHDRTVSRRHVSFQLNNPETSPPRVSFQVIGNNPIWVSTTTNHGGATLKLFRKFDEGHLELGDRFSLSGKAPFWFHFKEKGPIAEPELNSDQVVDVSGIDPVKEFGFLVIGHEFDQYPKGVIRNAKDWEWFLEEPSKDSEDDEDFEERRKMRRKRKSFKDNEDDKWTGDSEDDRVVVAKTGKGKIPKYTTRSKDRKGPNKEAIGSSNSKRKKAVSVNETVEKDEEDDDETLGGFIVTDEEEDEEEENDGDEEEEEFEEDDDDDVVEE
ncbi:double-strand break repair protein mus-23 [Lotus japonicus]|uniref:double-strand break repair protein mus-23 n=1 Tax=Lotus japonicus TaxID=34305 RepID=UPI00258F0CDC|nr:double-strand break repair protein mus-23 [Lotus japonicus]